MMKNNKFLGFNIIITSISLLFIIFGLIGTFAYEPSKLKDTKEVTGIIEEYKQRDSKWYDVIAGGTIDSYFNIRLRDNSFYEATGINYDNIDRSLFDIIKEGEEITITYIDNGWSSPNDIVSIEYQGMIYLDYEKVINEFEQNNKIMKIVGPSIIIVTIGTAITLYIINYKKNKLLSKNYK